MSYSKRNRSDTERHFYHLMPTPCHFDISNNKSSVEIGKNVQKEHKHTQMIYLICDVSKITRYLLCLYVFTNKLNFPYV